MNTEAVLHFSPASLQSLNAAIFLIMFGVALNLKSEHFKLLFTHPKPVLTGLLSQLLVLPALTAGLVWVLKPDPDLAMGMLLVASCPGGSVSNFFSLVAGGNLALSVSLSAVTTLTAALLTPLNFGLWSSLVMPTEAAAFSLSFVDLVQTLVIILLAPVALGLLVQRYFPATSQKLKPWFSTGSFVVLLAIIGVAFWNNRALFAGAIERIFLLVLLHNGLALLSGYLLAKVLGNRKRDCRTIAIETGIQNSGLGLIIVFSFFGGNSGMGMVAAWWGIWHIVSGSTVATFWKRRPTQSTVK